MSMFGPIMSAPVMGKTDQLFIIDLSIAIGVEFLNSIEDDKIILIDNIHSILSEHTATLENIIALDVNKDTIIGPLNGVSISDNVFYENLRRIEADKRVVIDHAINTGFLFDISIEYLVGRSFDYSTCLSNLLRVSDNKNIPLESVQAAVFTFFKNSPIEWTRELNNEINTIIENKVEVHSNRNALLSYNVAVLKSNVILLDNTLNFLDTKNILFESTQTGALSFSRIAALEWTREFNELNRALVSNKIALNINRNSPIENNLEALKPFHIITENLRDITAPKKILLESTQVGILTFAKIAPIEWKTNVSLDKEVIINYTGSIQNEYSLPISSLRQIQFTRNGLISYHTELFSLHDISLEYRVEHNLTKNTVISHLVGINLTRDALLEFASYNELTIQQNIVVENLLGISKFVDIPISWLGDELQLVAELWILKTRLTNWSLKGRERDWNLKNRNKSWNTKKRS